MEEYHLPQEIEPKINKIIAKRVDQQIQAMLENGSLTSARGGTGMTEVAVGMGLAPSGGGGQGKALMDPAEQEPAHKRSRIEHGESDYDKRHNLKWQPQHRRKLVSW